MSAQPTLKSNRLNLRPLLLSDAADVQSKAGDYRVATMAENIPYPYLDGMAEDWISTHESGWKSKERVTWAICPNDADRLIGCIGLVLYAKHCRASLGYWVAYEHWGKGFCSEAATAVVEFGFEKLKLQRIEAIHLTMNPASGAVMRKIGMAHEGTMRSYVIREGVFEDMERYAVLVNEQ